MESGIIELDSERGKEIGFTSDKFGAHSYLWEKDGAIIISFIESLQKGNFKDLVNTILDQGLRVEVPTPLDEMKRIVEKCGYKKTIVSDPIMGPVELWCLSPGKVHK